MNAAPSTPGRRRKALIFASSSAAALLCALAVPPAWAVTLPSGGTVAQGTVSIGAASGGRMTITQSSARAVVNWSSFSVGAGGNVTFSQPASSSAILNRVAAGAGQSVIDGEIDANGQVFLVNPNGVAISSTGVINTTGGFVASSLDISDTDFMAGNLNFSGASTGPGVSNAGSITAGSGGFVALIGQSAANSGTITVPLGQIGLGAAASATLDPDGSGFLQVALPADATNASGQALVSNTGTVSAAGGVVVLSAAVAADAVQQAVNTSGVIEATSASGVSGSVTLSASPGGDMAVGGSIDVSDTAGGTGGVVSLVAGGNLTDTATIDATSNNDGGRVDMTGANVSLVDASVDVSGANAGGLIRIGGEFDGGAADNGSGDYQYFVTRFGTLPSLANATTVTVDANSSLQANGALTTTGGTISLFSTEDTSIYTTNWRANGLDGAAAVASWGAIGNLTFSTNQSDGGPDTAEHLFYGAQDILIADAPDTSGYSYLNRLDLMANIRNARTVTIATSDSLDVVGDFDPMEGPGVFDIESLHGDNVQSLPVIYQQGALRDVTLDAGASITVDGVLDSQAGDLSIIGNDPTANNAPAGTQSDGAAIIDLREASLDTDQIEDYYGVAGESGSYGVGRNITITLLAGSDDGVGGLIRLPAIDPWQNSQAGEGGSGGYFAPDFTNLTVSAGGQSAIEFNGNVGTNLGFQQDGFGNDYNPPSGTLSLSGGITFAADSTIASNNLIWNGVGVDQTYIQSQISAGAISAGTGLSPGTTVDYVFENGLAPANDQSDESPTVGNPVYSGSVTAPIPLVSLPVNGSLQVGSASIDSSVANVLTITQTSEQAVFDWDSFNIGAGGTVTFVQPDSSAAVLNRVSASATASEIDGTLSANGQVYLVNPNGIAIGADGVVNTTGGFIASSASMALGEFTAGNLNFTGAAAAVTNAGTITAGSGGLVALLGSTVGNSGTITAPGGQIALAAGGAFSLESGDGSVVQITAATPDATASDTLLSQTGTLAAAGGVIALMAEGSDPSLDQTLDNSGTVNVQGTSLAGGAILIDAMSADAAVGGTLAADQTGLGFGDDPAGGAGGVISLAADGSLALTGALSAQGDSGGRIDVTGGTVSLTGATLDASGQTNGGLLRIGAAFRYGAADDGSAAYEAFVDRFGALPALATAGSVTIDSTTTLKAGGGTSGGALIVGSADSTAVSPVWADSIADVSISSQGVVSTLPDFALAPGGLDTLQLGAQSVEITSGAPSGSGVTAFDLQTITGSLSGLSNLLVEASDTISVTAGASLALAPGDSVSLLAGRGVTFTGVFNAGGASLLAVANDPDANGESEAGRSTGPGFIDLTGGTVESDGAGTGDLGFVLDAGLDNAVGGEILLPAIDRSGGVPGQALFGDISFEADGAGRIVLNGDIATQTGALTLTGDLQVDAASTLTSDTLTWTNSASAAIYGPGTGDTSFSADVALVDDGTVFQRGVVGDGQAARIALDGLSTGADATAVYGADADDLANQAFRLINGSLAVGDTLGTDLSPGTVTVDTGSASLLGVGDQPLTVTIANGLPQPGDKVGYVFDLTASSVGAVDITPRPLTYDTPNAQSTYGTLATLSGTLSNIISGDDVSAVFGLTQSGAPVTLGARTAAGDYQIVAASLTGASAANYEISATGDTAGQLTISPLMLTGYAGPSLTGVYGTTPTLAGGTLSGVLSGDAVTPVLGLAQDGSAVAVTSRVNAGTYDVTLTGLSGAQGSDYSLPVSNLTDGQLIVSPLEISATLANASYTYGSPASFVTLNGVLAGDTLLPTVNLTPNGGTVSGLTLQANGSGYGLAANTNAGAYSAVVTGLAGASAGDYVLAANLSAAAIQIDPKPITFSVPGGQTSVYGADTVSGATLGGVLAGDMVDPVYYVQSGANPATPLIPQTSVGAYALLIGGLTGASAGNYVVASSGNADGSLSITVKTVDFTLENLVSTYGSVADPVIDTPGLLAGDDVTFDVYVFGDNRLTTNNIYTPATNGSPYALSVSIGGSAAGNYSFQSSGLNDNPTWTVNPKPITYAGGNASSIYGSPVSLSTALSGILPGDQVSGSLAVTTTGGAGISYGAYTDVGTYDIGIGGLSGAQAVDYVIDPSVFGLLTITPKTVTYGGGTIDATYGTAASLPADLAGVLPGDDVSATLVVAAPGGAIISYDATTTVGTYSLSETSLTGAKAFDYTLSAGGNGSLVIAPKTVTYGGGNVSATYGTAATLSDAINGLVAGDEVTAPLVVTAAGGTAISYGARSSAGSYTLSLGALSGPEAVDYVIDPSVTGLLTVAPKPITLASGAFSATYGDADLPSGDAAADVIGGQFSGVLTGDAVEGDFAIASPQTTASGRLAAGAYALGLLPGAGGLTGAEAADYVLSPTSPTTGSLVVAQKTISLTSAALTATYGDADLQSSGAVSDQTGGVFSGILSGDGVSGVFSVAASLNANGRLDVGTYGLTLLSGAGGLTGAEAADYVLSVASPTTGSLAVAPKPITLTSEVLGATYGDASLGAVGSIAAQDGGQFSGILSGDDVTGVFAISGALNSAGRLDVGIYQLSLEAGSAGLAGAQADDYVLSPGSPTAGALTISPRTLTYAGGDVSTTYGTQASLDDAVDGLLSGDQVSAPVAVTDSAGAAVAYGARTSAGDYSLNLGALTGAQAIDYVVDPSAAGLLAIAPKPITLTSGAVSAAYGDASVSPQNFEWIPVLDGGQFSGVLPGDSVTGVFAIAGVTLNDSARMDVGTYQLSLEAGSAALAGAQAGDYVLSPGSPTTGVLTISPRTVTYGGGDVSTTYGTQADPLNLIDGVLGGDDVFASVTVTDSAGAVVDYGARTSAGDYTLSLGSLSGPEAFDYVVGASAAGLLVIAPKPITLTSADFTAIYGAASLGAVGSIAAQDGGQFSGVFGEDSVTGVFQVSGALNSAGRLDVGTYQLSLEAGSAGLAGAQAGDYVLSPGSPTTGVLTISPRTLTYGGGDVSTTYGTQASLADTIDGLLSGDQVSASVAVLDSSGNAVDYGARTSAGDYTLSLGALSGAQALDYVVGPSPAGLLAIAPKPVTLTSAALDAAYGDVSMGADGSIAAQDGGQFSGVLSGDSVAGVFAVSGALNSAGFLNVGTYQLSLETGSAALAGAQAGDYVVALGSATLGQLTVTPRPITYTIAPLTSVYGDAPTFSYSLTNAFAGMGTPVIDVAAAASGAPTLSPDGLDVGTYYPRIVGISGDSLSNYTLTFADPATSQLTITPRPVTFTAAYSTTYGSNLVPASQFQAMSGSAGVLPGDTLTATTAITGETIGDLDVGTYAYDQLSFGGAKLDDYAVSVVGPQTVTVTPKTLDVTFFNSGLTQQYGSNPSSNYDEQMVEVDGFVGTSNLSLNIDAVDAEASGNVNLQSGNFFTIYTPPGQSQSQGSITLTLNPQADVCNCTYSVTGISGPTAKDYVINPNSSTFTITPAPLTVVNPGNINTTYGQANLVGPSLSGFLFSSDATSTSVAISSASANLLTWAGSAPLSLAYETEIGAEMPWTLIYNDSFDPSGKATSLDVGTYGYTITGLTGPAAKNYYIASGSTTGSVTITPATLSYSVLQDEYYGEQKGVQLQTSAGTVYLADTYPDGYTVFDADQIHDSICCAMESDTSPISQITSNTFGANVALSLTFVDSSGVSHAYTPTLEAGTYNVNATITGPQAEDFVLQSTPVTFTVHPAIITYTITGGDYYVQDAGYIEGGALPTATLTGVYGSDQVGLVIGVFQGATPNDRDGADLVNIDTAAPGVYHYQAVGLLVADPNNYVLGPASAYFDGGPLVDVVSPTLSFNPDADLTVAVASGVSVVSGVAVAATPTTASTSSTSGALSDAASVSVGGSESASTSLGDATGTAAATGGASATAKAGLTGASATATASSSASLTVSYGPGYTAVGVSATTSGSATLSLISKSPNISGAASAEVQTYVTTGVAGSLGAAGTGSASATGSAEAQANADGTVGVTDGTVTAGGGAWAGAGVSGTVTGGISGSAGSAQAGVTGNVGSAGVTVSPSIGFSNGDVTVGAQLGLGIGVVGVDININVAINLDTVASGLTTVWDAIFGSPSPPPPDFVQSVKAVTANPFTDPIAYRDALYTIVNNVYQNPGSYSNVSWAYAGTVMNLLNAQSAYATLVTSTIPALQKTTATLVNQLQTDPAGFTDADLQALQLAQQNEAAAVSQLQSDVSTMTGGQSQAVITAAGIDIVPVTPPAATGTSSATLNSVAAEAASVATAISGMIG